MKKMFALALLVVLFFLALSPDWSLISLGEQLAQDKEIATIICEGVMVLIGVAAVIFIYSSLKGSFKE